MFKLLVIISMLFFTSCATKVHGLQKSADFNYTSVVSGKILIGGIVHTNEEWDYKKKISMANTFKTEIREERRDIRVDNAGFLVKRVGRGIYREMLREISEDGFLSDANIELLAKSVKKYRYVVFGRIENDRVQNSRNESEVLDSQGKATGRREVKALSQRDMDINFLVYDLTTKTQSWNGVIKKYAQNEHKYLLEKETNLGKIIDLFAGVKSQDDMNKKYPFPKAPTDRKILVQAFRGFAENLPEKD